MGIQERKERERERRRQQIMVAAKRVFSVKGFGKTTMEDIAKDAELSPGTLYLYFSEMHMQNPDSLIDMIMTSGDRYDLSPEQILKVRLVRTGAGGPLAQTKNILKDIAQRVNS